MVECRYLHGAVYVFENSQAQRVKVGMTINNVADRLRHVNDMWLGRKATMGTSPKGTTSPFIRGRHEGASTSESTRRAALDLLAYQRARGRTTYPCHWAGFVTAGDRALSRARLAYRLAGGVMPFRRRYMTICP